MREAGWRLSENAVAQLMREQGLAARRKKKRRSATRPGRGRWRAPTWSADFLAAGIDRKWYGDGTEIPTGQGKLYLASVLDIGSRRVLGSPWASITTRGWPTAPWLWRWRSAAARCLRILHTDRAANTPRAPSARPAPGWASAGPWAGPGPPWTTRSSNRGTRPGIRAAAPRGLRDPRARARVAAWIEEYNTTRRHSACGMMPPWPGRRPRRRARGRRGPQGRCAAARPGRRQLAAHLDEKAAAPGLGTRRAKVRARPPA